jgi:hypothetical protein
MGDYSTSKMLKDVVLYWKMGDCLRHEHNEYYWMQQHYWVIPEHGLKSWFSAPSCHTWPFSDIDACIVDDNSNCALISLEKCSECEDTYKVYMEEKKSWFGCEFWFTLTILHEKR